MARNRTGTLLRNTARASGQPSRPGRKKNPSDQEGRTIMRWLPQSASATCQTSTMP